MAKILCVNSAEARMWINLLQVAETFGHASKLNSTIDA